MRNHKFAALMRLVVVSGALLTAAARSAAQTACPVSEQVGWIGIDGISCNNCEFGRGSARFSTEPRINNIAANSPAADILRPGDLISSVNGALITTAEGANLYSSLIPGQSLTLLVRRDGQLVTARFNNIPGRCRNDDSARAAIAAGRALRARGAGGGTVSAAPSMAPLQRGRLVPTAAAGGFGSHVSRVIFGFGISCNDCEPLRFDRNSNGENALVWKFNSAPTLYSVETDGPAWRAGLRRGDVITEIDGIDVTSEEAGRRFGAVQPGQNVRFTYRRGNDSRTAAVTAIAPAGVVVAAQGREIAAAAESSIRRMQDLVSEINARERAKQAFVDQLKSSDDERLRETIKKYEVDQVEQSRKLRELQSQLAATELRMRPTPAPRGPGGRGGVAAGNANTIRYSGHLGSTDIEIRGSRPVVVDESPDEIVIRTGDAEIRLKRRGSRE